MINFNLLLPFHLQHLPRPKKIIISFWYSTIIVKKISQKSKHFIYLTIRYISRHPSPPLIWAKSCIIPNSHTHGWIIYYLSFSKNTEARSLRTNICESPSHCRWEAIWLNSTPPYYIDSSNRYLNIFQIHTRDLHEDYKFRPLHHIFLIKKRLENPSLISISRNVNNTIIS